MNRTFSLQEFKIQICEDVFAQRVQTRAVNQVFHRTCRINSVWIIWTRTQATDLIYTWQLNQSKQTKPMEQNVMTEEQYSFDHKRAEEIRPD